MPEQIQDKKIFMNATISVISLQVGLKTKFVGKIGWWMRPIILCMYFMYFPVDLNLLDSDIEGLYWAVFLKLF